MALIKLDAAELKYQASEMTALGTEYEHLFSSVSSILKDVNNNWSPNLANNFSGKIASAQKGFSNVVEMLNFGAEAANSSAESFGNIDTEISRVLGGFANNASAAAAHIGSEVITSQMNEASKEKGVTTQQLKDVATKENLKKIRDKYDSLPKWAQELIEKYLEDNDADGAYDVIDVLLDIISEDPENWKTLDVNPDIIEGLYKIITGDGLKGNALKETYDAVMNPDGRMKDMIESINALDYIIIKKIESGDIIGALGDFGIYVGLGLGTICYGTVEVFTEMGAGFIDKYWSIRNSIYGTVASILPGRYGEAFQWKYNNDKAAKDTVCGFIRDLL